MSIKTEEYSSEMSISIGIGSSTIFSKCTLDIYKHKLRLIYSFEGWCMWILKCKGEYIRGAALEGIRKVVVVL